MKASLHGPRRLDPTGLTLRCEVRGTTTVLSVFGSLDVQQCGQLRDGLELARLLRGRGPIQIDLDRVDRLSTAAALVLIQAMDEVTRAGRPLRPA
jgi:anti-anti-sigma regulatory factor